MATMKTDKDSSPSEVSFLNRELSWLEFNRRVLAEAMDPTIPLLERLQFLSITASNLDEFFMVRIGGLRLLLSEGITREDLSGFTPEELKKKIDRRVRLMIKDQYGCYQNQLEPELKKAGISRAKPERLSPQQYEYLQEFFRKTILPVASPIGLGPGRPFPLLSGLGLNIAVRLRRRKGQIRERFIILPLGPRLERFIFFPSHTNYLYLLLEDVVLHFLDQYFPEERIAESNVFRITRNADLTVEEDDAEDFLDEMQSVLRLRKTSGCVRLEIGAAASPSLRRFLCRNLRMDEDQIYPIDGPLDLSAFRRLVSLPGFDRLRNEPWQPQVIPGMDPRKNIFEEIGRRNLILLHPYQTIDPVVRLLEEAAEDPDVLAIKQILYRTSAESPIVAALCRAAEQGKHVTVIVELKARFDEARNISWARQLEDAGVQVIHGIKGLKTHAKVCIVVRREMQGIVRYMHFGTGNYNEKTARLYSDIGYMTCDADLGSDAVSFFHAITGYSVPMGYQKIEAAPLGLRAKLLELIAAEIQRWEAGQGGTIMAKMNSLEDPEIIRALYQASCAGVPVFLNVRGICCLQPGVPGMSENINVVSIVDRFLEHSRIIYFYQGGEEKVFISSADWMPRNLDRRIELLVPIEDPSAMQILIDALHIYFADNVKSWKLQEDGTYIRSSPSADESRVRSQEVLYRKAREIAGLSRRPRRTSFEPHLSPLK